MNWPGDERIWELLARVSVAFVLAIVASRIFSGHLVLRRCLWGICFAAPFLLLLPVPKVPIEVGALATVPQASDALVYELRSELTESSVRYLDDPGPSGLLWLISAAGMVGLSALAARMAVTLRIVRSAEQVVDEELIDMMYELGQHYGLNDVPVLKRSDAVDSPCVWGFLQPVILIPTNFALSSSEEWRLLLEHEIAHIAYKDPLRMLLYSVVTYALWWNPLLWAGYRQAILTQELIVDAKVGPTDRYSQLLVRGAKQGSTTSIARLFGQGHLLCRIRALTGKSRTDTSSAPLASLLGLLPVLLPWHLRVPYHPDPLQIGDQEVVFQSDRVPPKRLWRMASDGRGPKAMPATFIGVGVPSVSPDGRWICYTRLVQGKEDLFIARVDGSAERRIVGTHERDVQGNWSPDGSGIVFCTLATGSWEVGLVDLSSNVCRLITNDGKVNLEPSWHPNGSRIVFSSHRTGLQKLWSMNVDGSALRQLTFGRGEDTAGRYSRSGRLLVFASKRRSKYDVMLLDLEELTVQPLTGLRVVDSGEARFVDGDKAVVMSTHDTVRQYIGRVDVGTPTLKSITDQGENHWPATR